MVALDGLPMGIVWDKWNAGEEGGRGGATSSCRCQLTMITFLKINGKTLFCTIYIWS